MSNNTGISVGSVPPSQLEEARLNAHHAVQWLAKITRSFLPPHKDDSHTSLSWLSEDKSLVTQYLTGNAIFGLVIPDLTLFCGTDKELIDELNLDGITNEDAQDWVYSCLKELGLPEEELILSLPYSIPNHSVDRHGTYDKIDTALPLQELSLWYDDSYKVLSYIKSLYAKQSYQVSEIKCWPHHFDIAMQIQLPSSDPEISPIIGIGMSPGDEYYNEPYFYVSPWPYLKPAQLSDLPFIGHWHVQGFVGAVAPGSKIIDMENKEDQLINFINEAISIGQTHLSI